jgi:hypothetical protein
VPVIFHKDATGWRTLQIAASRGALRFAPVSFEPDRDGTPDGLVLVRAARVPRVVEAAVFRFGQRAIQVVALAIVHAAGAEVPVGEPIAFIEDGA